MNSAERVHRHRERRQRGVLGMVPTEVTSKLLRKLVKEGWLDAKARDDSEVATAISEMLDTWAHE